MTAVSSTSSYGIREFRKSRRAASVGHTVYPRVTSSLVPVGWVLYIGDFLSPCTLCGQVQCRRVLGRVLGGRSECHGSRGLLGEGPGATPRPHPTQKQPLLLRWSLRSQRRCWMRMARLCRRSGWLSWMRKRPSSRPHPPRQRGRRDTACAPPPAGLTSACVAQGYDPRDFDEVVSAQRGGSLTSGACAVPRALAL